MNLDTLFNITDKELEMLLEEMPLKGLNHFINVAENRKKNILKANRNLIDSENRVSLTIGDIVRVSGKKFVGEIWEVLKLNPKKVKCKRENGETWNIPYAHVITS